MEIQYRAFGGRIIAKVEGDTLAKLFENIAQLAEVFDADSNCGMCGSAQIRPNFRKAQGFSFYELKCNCGARLSFGQHKEGGGLWAKRSNEAGDAMDHNGWSKHLAIAAPAAQPQQARPAAAAPATNGVQRQAPYSRKPPVSRPDDAKLTELLRHDPNETIGELCNALRAIYDGEGPNQSSPKTDAAWVQATRDNATDAQVIRSLYWKIEEEVPTTR